MKRISIFIIAAMTLSCTTEYTKLDKMCRDLFPEGEPGAAVIVVREGKTVFEKCYGIADIDTKEAITPDSFFNIASCSKQFTAVAVLQLVEKGLLTLDTTVASLCPDLSAPIWSKVTIRHLLSHSSGVPDKRGYLTREQKIKGDEALAMEYLPNLDELNFEPGTEYEYINPTFVLLGRIVSSVSGMPFTDYVRENIFLPAGMNTTLYFSPEETIPNMTHAYEYGDVENMPEESSARVAPSVKEWFEYDYGEETFFATRPDGGIYTSINELLKWEEALKSASVLGEDLLCQAWEPHTKVSGSTWSDYQNRPGTWYGYGWFVEPDRQAGRCIYHTGDNGGYKILISRYPETNSLVMVLASRADYDRYELKTRIESICNI